ncbi:MAG TPA: glycosyltransferase [Thermoanaerobaculia bacterium]
MRVLHCIPTLGEGGAERQLAHLTNELPVYGVDVHLALMKEGVMRKHFHGQPQLHLLPVAGSYDPRLVTSLVRLIRRLQPDIVQSWLTQMDVVGGSAAKLTRGRWILTERSSEMAYAPSPKTTVRNALGRRADAIIANSYAGLEYWKRQRPRTTLLRRIPNAVSVAVPAAASMHQPLRPPRTNIVSMNRLSPDKNHRTLVEALAFVDITARICGTGPTEPLLRERVAALGIGDRVTFAGHVADVAEAHRSSDLFVSISHFEGLPNSVIEAALSGVPLVLSDIPAHRELFDDEQALFVDGSDPRSVANGLRRGLADPDAAVRRARNARNVVEQWKPRVIAGEYHRLYQELLDK